MHTRNSGEENQEPLVHIHTWAQRFYWKVNQYNLIESCKSASM